MAKLENFSNLTKGQEDVLKKYYCFGSLGLLNLNITTDSLTFHTRLAERVNEVPRASAWLQYKNDLLLVKAKRRNDGFSHYKLEVTPAKLLANFKLMFECKLSSGETPVDATLNAEYNHEKFKSKLSYLTSSKAVRAQVTAGKPDCGFGVDSKFNVEHLSLMSHTEAIWCDKNGARLVLKHIGTSASIGSFEVSHLQKVSDVTTVASKVVADWAKKTTEVHVGGEYKYDSSTWIKGKVGSNGLLGLAVTKVLSDSLRASVASELKTQSLLVRSSDVYKFGLRLDFTH